MVTINEIRKAMKREQIEGTIIDRPKTIGKSDDEINQELCNHELDEFKRGKMRRLKEGSNIINYKCKICGYIFSTEQK